MRVAHETVLQPAAAVRGPLRVPGDKSISHRYALLAAIADGPSTLSGYAPGADCHATLACLRALGVEVSAADGDGELPPIVRIEGRGLRGLGAPSAPLDCGNSGSTMRMLAGVLAAHPFAATLVGDASLSRRPMRRIMAPLAQMGARLEAGADGRPPLLVHGAALRGLDFAPDTPSAQVKSAVLLAGLQAEGRTSVREPALTRDHTERALRAFGAEIEAAPRTAALAGGQRLAGRALQVPGDISSAAFAMVAAAALPGSDVTVEDVGLNPTRAGLVILLRRFGAEVGVDPTGEWAGEPVGRIRVRHGGHGTLVVAPDEVPEVIDELPALAALATFGGEVRVTGASELRVKESDRIAALVAGLRALGADADELPDGFHVRGGRRLAGGTADACHDHRLAMAFAIAALGATGPSHLAGADVVAVSYPGFFGDLDRLRA